MEKRRVGLGTWELYWDIAEMFPRVNWHRHIRSDVAFQRDPALPSRVQALRLQPVIEKQISDGLLNDYLVKDLKPLPLLWEFAIVAIGGGVALAGVWAFSAVTLGAVIAMAPFFYRRVAPVTRFRFRRQVTRLLWPFGWAVLLVAACVTMQFVLPDGSAFKLAGSLMGGVAGAVTGVVIGRGMGMYREAGREARAGRF